MGVLGSLLRFAKLTHNQEKSGARVKIKKALSDWNIEALISQPIKLRSIARSVNKFKEEALAKNNFEEEKGAAPEQKRVQIGQSKVGKKKFTRGISSANDGAPAAIPSFKKKFNLQLGNAVKTFEEKAVNIDMPMGPGTAPMAPPMSQP